MATLMECIRKLLLITFISLFVSLSDSEKSMFGLYFDNGQLERNPSIQNFEQGFYAVVRPREDILTCDLTCLKNFTNAISRPDLTSKIANYECELQIIMILSQYIDFRDESLPSPMASDYQKDVSRYLYELEMRSSQSLKKTFTYQAKQGHTSSIRKDIEMFCEEICKGQLSWAIVLEILLFSSELAYRRMWFRPGPSKFQKWLNDIDEIRLVLREIVVPWMAHNGGVGKLAVFIEKQDPVKATRMKNLSEELQKNIFPTF